MEAKQHKNISAKENIILGKSEFLLKIKLLLLIGNEVNVKKKPRSYAGLNNFIILLRINYCIKSSTWSHSLAYFFWIRKVITA